MGKDLKGKELGKGITQRKDGRFMARGYSGGTRILLYGNDLESLVGQFEMQKKRALAGVFDSGGNVTLDVFFAEWFETYKRPKIKESSRTPLMNRYKSTFSSLIGNMKIKDIKQIDIQYAINKMLEDGQKSVSGIKEALGMLQSCFEVAKYNYIIDRNPCFEIVLKGETVKREVRFMTNEEIQRFLEAIQASWYNELFYIMLHTGLRIGEVGGLQWSDIDFEKKQIRIQRSLTAQYDKGIKTLKLGTPKTINSYRTIPFMKNVSDALMMQQEKQKRIKENLQQRWRAPEELGELVFTTTMGSPVTRYIAEKELNKIVNTINYEEEVSAKIEKRQAKKFQKLYPHALRHSFCSLCYQQGLNAKFTQEIMGHKSLSTTLDYYTHFMADSGEEVKKFEQADIPGYNVR